MTWAPDYATTEELKNFVRIPDDADDVEVALAIAAASRAIDRACNRQFGSSETAVDRYYTASYERRIGRWIVAIDDVMDVTGMVVSFDSNDDASYSSEIDECQLKPINAAADGRPWTQLAVHPRSSTIPNGREGGVEVHAIFGWTAVPDTIKQATLLQASRVLARRNSPFGVAGSPEAGTEIRLLAKLDPDVNLMVRSYYRWWAAA